MARTVHDDDVAHEFVITDAGRPIGFSRYRLEPGAIVFTHTEVIPSQRDTGAADLLTRRALDDVRARGLQVRTECSYVDMWMRCHPDDEPLRTPRQHAAAPAATPATPLPGE